MDESIPDYGKVLDDLVQVALAGGKMILAGAETIHQRNNNAVKEKLNCEATTMLQFSISLS